MHDIREDFEKEESKVCGQKRSVSEVDTESKSGHRQLRSAISVSEVASQDNSKSAAITQPKSKRKAISPNISLSSTVDKFIPELSIRYICLLFDTCFLSFLMNFSPCTLGQICWKLLEICSFKQEHATLKDK